MNHMKKPPVLGDIQDARLLWLKFVLFLVIGVLGTVAVFVIAPSWSMVTFHLLAVWAFCRAYYFAFYVIEHYMDPGYRFAGLGSFVRYACRRWYRSE